MAPTTLFLSNFPFVTTEAELRSLVEAHCPIRGIRIITDRETGRSRGFAFVEVAASEDADIAIEALNDSMLGGRRLVVSHAKGRANDRAEKAPNAAAAPGSPFKHRIIIEWVEEDACYAAEVPDFEVSARGETIQQAVRQAQALSKRSLAVTAGARS